MIEKVEKEVTSVVQSGSKIRVYYRTSDGRDWSSEHNAIKHEEDLDYAGKLLKIQKVELPKTCSIMDDYTTWFKPRTEEELEVVKSYLNFNNSYVDGISYKQLVVGEWVSGKCVFGGDYFPDAYSIITLKDIQKQITDFNRMFSVADLNKI